MFNINIKDELGTHTLNSDRDCEWVCPICNKEVDVIDIDVKRNTLISPKCPSCHNRMKLSYWLDQIHDEEEYTKLIKNK
ncbi:hypothetical protein ACFHWD_03545 [Clostridium sp. MT-14]|uniref:hypothetical protein n=1 Tax=Clostridium sp. MT-14 TaxID=3348360 RepID=UPI0035F2415C